MLDEAANIAPIRDLAPRLSQCGDHGITIAASWQSIAQIDERHGKAERDAILTASTAQVFLPPLADPATTEYITGLLGISLFRRRVTLGGGSQETISVNEQHVASAPWLRQVRAGRALLVYRDLPPAIVRAPRWFEDAQFAGYRRFVNEAVKAARRV